MRVKPLRIRHAWRYALIRARKTVPKEDLIGFTVRIWFIDFYRHVFFSTIIRAGKKKKGTGERDQ